MRKTERPQEDFCWLSWVLGFPCSGFATFTGKHSGRRLSAGFPRGLDHKLCELKPKTRICSLSGESISEACWSPAGGTRAANSCRDVRKQKSFWNPTPKHGQGAQTGSFPLPAEALNDFTRRPITGDAQTPSWTPGIKPQARELRFPSEPAHLWTPRDLVTSPHVRSPHPENTKPYSFRSFLICSTAHLLQQLPRLWVVVLVGENLCQLLVSPQGLSVKEKVKGSIRFPLRLDVQMT